MMQVMDIIVKKEHLTRECFVKILSIKSVFPKGLSSKVLESYKNVSPIVKPIFQSNTEDGLNEIRQRKSSMNKKSIIKVCTEK